MKGYIAWGGSAALLMIGCPWLAVEFAGSASPPFCYIAAVI